MEYSVAFVRRAERLSLYASIVRYGGINAPSIPDVHVTDATPIVSGIRNNMTIYATIGLYAQQKDVTTIFYRK